MPGSLSSISPRLAIGLVLIAAVVWWTFDRLAMEEDNDPSLSLGGDWIIFRASGPALVGLVLIGAAVVLGPQMSGPLALLLAGLAGFWVWTKAEEVDDD